MTRQHATMLKLDVDQLAINAQTICDTTGVHVWAVVKADAYGLGTDTVCDALADAVDGWCTFSLEEVIRARLAERYGKPSRIIGPLNEDAATHVTHRAHPAVASLQQALAMASAGPMLCVDTGMQRFACPPDAVHEALSSGVCAEAFTHAIDLSRVRKLFDLTGAFDVRRHAAGSSLLSEPAAWLDGVRPGIALYEGAIQISTRLQTAHESRGPVGYTGFGAQRHGVIHAGYLHGLRPGVCEINGEVRAIPEVGMQSAYVELAANDKPGDEVVLLGRHVTPALLAQHWGCPAQQVLVSLARPAIRA